MNPDPDPIASAPAEGAQASCHACPEQPDVFVIGQELAFVRGGIAILRNS